MVLLVNRCDLTGKDTARGVVTTLVDQRERLCIVSELATRLQAASLDDEDTSSLDDCSGGGGSLNGATSASATQESGGELDWPKKREDREWTKANPSKARSKPKAKSNASTGGNSADANTPKLEQGIKKGKGGKGKSKQQNCGKQLDALPPTTSSTSSKGPRCTIPPGWHRALRNIVLANVKEVENLPPAKHNLTGLELEYDGLRTRSRSAKITSAASKSE